MPGNEDIQASIIKAAIQAAAVVVRGISEADLPAKAQTRRSIPEEQHRPRQAGPKLGQPAFDWKASHRYVELLHFEIEVSNVLQAEMYDLNDKEKVPIIWN